MKKQYRFLIIIVVMLQFLFTGCNQQNKIITVGPGTEESISFNSLREFKENFADFMAFPSYIPFKVDSLAKFKKYASSYNEKGFEERPSFVNNPDKKYKRIDIFNSVRMRYSVDVNDNELTDEHFYKLSVVEFVYLPSRKIDESNLEQIEYEEYSVYYGEYFESELFYPEKKGYNGMHLHYYTSLDDKVYVFSIQYFVKLGTSKEKFLELRDKLKAEALPEVIKSYKSLKYENKD